MCLARYIFPTFYSQLKPFEVTFLQVKPWLNKDESWWEFAWEFSKLSCPGQTSTRSALRRLRSNETEQDKTGWESLDITAAKTLIKIWTTNGSCNFHPRLTFAIYFIVCNCFFWVKKGLIIIVFPRITFVSGRSLNQLQSVFTTDIKAQETRLWKCGRITDNTATALTSSEPPYQNSTLVETLYKKLGNVFIFIKREINQK